MEDINDKLKHIFNEFSEVDKQVLASTKASQEKFNASQYLRKSNSSLRSPYEENSKSENFETTAKTKKSKDTFRSNKFIETSKIKKKQLEETNKCLRCQQKHKNSFFECSFYPNGCKENLMKSINNEKDVQSIFDNLYSTQISKNKIQKNPFLSRNTYSPYNLYNSYVYDEEMDINHCLDLYNRGMEFKQRKKTASENHTEEIKNQIDPECTFKPKINRKQNSSGELFQCYGTNSGIKMNYNSNTNNNNINNNNNSNQQDLKKTNQEIIKGFIHRNYGLNKFYKAKKEKVLSKIRKEEQFPYEPKIIKNWEQKNDVNTIQHEVPYINDFALRRRKIIKEEEDRKTEEENRYKHPLSVSKRRYYKNNLDKSYDEYIKRHMSKSKTKIRSGSGNRVLGERNDLSLSHYFDEKSYLTNNFSNYPQFDFEKKKKKCEPIEIEKLRGKDEDDDDNAEKKTLSCKSTNDEDFIQAIKNISKVVVVNK